MVTRALASSVLLLFLIQISYSEPCSFLVSLLWAEPVFHMGYTCNTGRAQVLFRWGPGLKILSSSIPLSSHRCDLWHGHCGLLTSEFLAHKQKLWTFLSIHHLAEAVFVLVLHVYWLGENEQYNNIIYKYPFPHKRGGFIIAVFCFFHRVIGGSQDMKVWELVL